MPLIRRLPKRGFNNAAFHKNWAVVNLDDLSAFEAGTTVNEQLLRESKLIRGNFFGVKILGDGELKHGLTVEADKVSAAARQKIESAGGTVTLREAPAPQGARATSTDAPAAEAPAPAQTAPAKKTAAKKTGAKKSGAKKSGAKKSGAKKSGAKKKSAAKS